MSDVSGLSKAEAPVSRVIEYFPPGGTKTTSRDCTYGGKTYSKGATITDEANVIQECSGDKDGSWVPPKKS